MVHFAQRTYAHSTVVKTVYVISSSAKENPSDLILMDSTKEEIDLYLSSTYYILLYSTNIWYRCRILLIGWENSSLQGFVNILAFIKAIEWIFYEQTLVSKLLKNWILHKLARKVRSWNISRKMINDCNALFLSFIRCNSY